LRRWCDLQFVPVLAVAGLAAGCGMIDRMSGVATARELQASGIAAEAEILSIWETGIKVNDEPVIGLKVTVKPPDGRPAYEATIPKSLVRFVDIPQFQPGKVIAVRIDPKNPSIVAIDVYKYR
jgi:hypothetical protein